MMKAVLALLCLTALVRDAWGFFDLLKQMTGTKIAGPEPGADPKDPARGIPDHLLARYQKEPFLCDNHQRQLPLTAVNDGFCDCADGSDEPSTSACAGSAIFHCRNPGYKVVPIPASRVDDSVCDCCDGSDEGLVKQCPNICRQVAERERAGKEKLLSAYKTGSAERQSAIKAYEEKQEQTRKELEDLNVRIGQLDGELNAAEDQLKQVRSAIAEIQKEEGEALETQLVQLLGFQDEKPQSVAQLVSSLVDVLDLDEKHLVALLPETSSIDIQDPVDLAHDGDEYEEPEAVPEDQFDVTNCAIFAMTNNMRLRYLCHASVAGIDTTTLLSDLLLALLRSHKPYTEVMLVLGHLQLHGNSDGVVDFVKEFLSRADSESCPAEFMAIETVCGMKEQLRNVMLRIDELLRKEEESEDVQRLQTEINALRQQRTELTRSRSEKEQMVNEAEQYRDFLAFLAIKGQCFEVVDGKFSYKLCIMGGITQKETDGFSSVSLGQFQSVEEVDSGRAFKLSYTNGQYCHAFGPRKAEVTAVCGEKHQLLSASEPSTCFYALQFETPMACTPQYGALQGLDV